MTVSRDLLRQLQQLLRPIRNSIANLVARADVQLVDDGKRMQILQVGAHVGEDIDDAERFQNYGFSSVPKAGAEAVVVFPGGDRGHPLVVSVDDRRYRPIGGQPGEVFMYTDEGDLVRLGRGQLVVIKTGGRLEVRDATDAALTANDELVHGTGVDPFTGATYKALGATTSKVRAKK